jgi:hypothetical protein
MLWHLGWVLLLLGGNGKKQTGKYPNMATGGRWACLR